LVRGLKTPYRNREAGYKTLRYAGISESKMEEVAGGWRRLHNEELHNLNNSQGRSNQGD